MARNLHIKHAVTIATASWISLSTALAGGCIIPPPLELEQPDGGTNHIPVIVSAAGDFQIPGPLVLDKQDPREMSLVLSDRDIDDTLYVNLYVDYGNPTPTPSLHKCTAPTSGTIERTANCPISNLCTVIADTEYHVLEAMVSDQSVADSGTPEFRALPEGAGFSTQAWLFKCSLI